MKSKEKFDKKKLAMALAAWKKAGAEVGKWRGLEDAEKIPERRKMIGRCFKFRNSYGSDPGKWWLYVRIVGLSEGGSMFKVHEFQTDSDGRPSIGESAHVDTTFQNSDYIPITEAEYREGILETVVKFGLVIP